MAAVHTAVVRGCGLRHKHANIAVPELLEDAVGRDVPDNHRRESWVRETFHVRIHSKNRASEEAMGFIAWIVVGLVAGWLAGQVMKGGGYGIVVDIILGILGGLLGGWIFGLLGIWQGGGMIGSIIVAFVGAVILVWITRLLKKA